MFYPLLVIFAILGLIMGSFIHCLATRLHGERSLGGRSFCFNCHQQIAWYDNIPLVSWLILRGRCRHCREKFAVSHFVLELASGLLYALSFIYFWFNQGSYLSLFVYFVAVTLWLLVFLSDYLWLEIYLPPLFVGAVLILLGQIFLGVSIVSLLFSVFLGVAFFGVQYLLTKGKGIGSGDIYLGGLMGLVFPDWRLLLTALFLSYVLGAIFGIGMIIKNKKNMKTKVPLGVFLTLGSLLALFVGRLVLAWYLGQLV